MQHALSANNTALQKITADLSCDISEVRVLSETLVHLDMHDRELYDRAAPYILRILADKAGALDERHNKLELEVIELNRAAKKRGHEC